MIISFILSFVFKIHIALILIISSIIFWCVIENDLFEAVYNIFKIGLLAFGGGYATIPLIEKFIVIENQFIDYQTMI